MAGMHSGVREPNSPEVALAVAVLECLIADLRSQCAARREGARRDVIDGGVQYWVDVVDGVFGAGERVNQELLRLVG